MDAEFGYNPEFIGENEYRFYALKPNESRVVNQSIVKLRYIVEILNEH